MIFLNVRSTLLIVTVCGLLSLQANDSNQSFNNNEKRINSFKNYLIQLTNNVDHCKLAQAYAKSEENYGSKEKAEYLYCINNSKSSKINTFKILLNNPILACKISLQLWDKEIHKENLSKTEETKRKNENKEMYEICIQSAYLFNIHNINNYLKNHRSPLDSRKTDSIIGYQSNGEKYNIFFLGRCIRNARMQKC